MKKIYLLICAALSCAIINAQTPVSVIGKIEKKSSKQPVAEQQTTANKKPIKCGYDLVMQTAKAKGFDNARFEAELQTLIQKRLSNQARFTGPVTIPVIFHVLHRTGQAVSTTSPNLAASQLQAQINQLNIDFGNTAGSAYGVASDAQIRFCLALVDTLGRPLAEPGIERINAQTKGWSNTNTQSDAALYNYFEGTIKPATIWNPKNYMNVWVAAMDASGLYGYAAFPSFSTLQGLDNDETSTTSGLVLNWQSVGSVASPGTDVYGVNLGRTASHELGHFFGLRHIWGDATCGDDYCADTPPQNEETSFICPTGNLPNNCTPAANKMYQNYMDYTLDACLNTFTLNQAQRMQTVMDNSPNRRELVNSKACVARPANAIIFDKAEFIVRELSSSTSCPAGTNYIFKITPSVSANGNATVTFTTSGTAVQGKDFSISPASINFVNGDAASQTVTVTIYDNGEVDGTKTLNLGYTISGSGVVAGPEKQSVNITILDNDFVSTIDNTTQTVTILSENFDASTNFPTGWSTESFVDATPGNVYVVGANHGLGTTGNAVYPTNNTSTKPNTYTNSITSDSYVFTPLIDASGLTNINLQFKWRCRGESGYDRGFLGYVMEGKSPTVENVNFFSGTYGLQYTTTQTANLNLPSSFNGQKFYLVFNWFNDYVDGNNPGFTFDDVVVTGKTSLIATSTDADTTFSHYSGKTITYTSFNASGNRIIAKVVNPSQDLGCVTASVLYSGNGKAALVTPSGTFDRSQKVIKLTPASANTTASYQVTLYYTTAELAAWGADVANLKMLKVQDGIDIFGTGINTGNAVIATPTVDDQRATKGYVAFTATFTNGFSQFMMASPLVSLPVNLISFEAKGIQKSIALKWITSQEKNNKGFAIERSTNATEFRQIGWVNGKGDANTESVYSYIDNFVQPGITYYYRLRQTDFDGKEKLTAVREAKINASEIKVSLSPNPAKHSVNLFVSGTDAKADVTIMNIQGQALRSYKQINASASATALNIGGLPAGTYIVNIVLPNEIRREKLIIQ